MAVLERRNSCDEIVLGQIDLEALYNVSPLFW